MWGLALYLIVYVFPNLCPLRLCLGFMHFPRVRRVGVRTGGLLTLDHITIYRMSRHSGQIRLPLIFV